MSGGVGVGVCYWELLYQIVEGEPPQLPADRFSKGFCDFVSRCMRKPTGERPTSTEFPRVMSMMTTGSVRGKCCRPQDGQSRRHPACPIFVGAPQAAQ